MIPPAPPPGPAPRVLYISGPFSHPDPVHGIPKNILLASEAALVEVRPGLLKRLDS